MVYVMDRFLHADLVIDETVIVEFKCCKYLLPEHQLQTIINHRVNNYLTADDLPVGLLVNFGHRILEYKRVEESPP
jgi:GxxExxY protein